MQKYYSDDLDNLASFLGEKFGFGAKTWPDLEATLQISISSDPQWDAGLTLGMVLAELRRSKSANSKERIDRDSQLTSRVMQPKRNKQKKAKR